jgi:predicted DNA binding CopG/RHH family protein
MVPVKRAHVVNARLTDAEYDELAAQVACSGLSVSDFIRQAIKQKPSTHPSQEQDMHSFDYSDDVQIFHNGDYSGDAVINVRISAERQLSLSTENGTTTVELHIPAAALVAFAHSATISQVIEVIEQLNVPGVK